MAENLKVTHYRNGEPIPNVTDPTAWSVLITGAYCEYDSDIANVAVYGRLYNWYAVDNGGGIAPEGWHVPSDAEWQTLVDYLGGDAIAGGKMKETGTTHWNTPNTGASNESGFTALPGGHRSSLFFNMGYIARFWSFTEGDYYLSAWSRGLGYNNPAVTRDIYDSGKSCGFSVRCIKD